MQTLARHGVLGFSSEAWISTGCISGQRIQDAATEWRAVTSDVAATNTSIRADALQSQAQRMLLLGRPADAADRFELCAREIRLQPRPDQQARACLIAGLQSLHSRQLRTAWNCLQRTIDAKGCPTLLAVEAHAALATLYFELGMRRPAAAAADCGIALLDAGTEAHRMPLAVLDALRVEFVALDLLRQHEQLSDLAFWPRHEEMAGARVTVGQARQAIAECRQRTAAYRFITARLDFLDALIGLAYQGAANDASALSGIEHLQASGLALHAQAARHEFALASIAARRADLLRQALRSSQANVGGRTASATESSHEHRYCLAKLGEMGGREDVYIQHYREYAAQALMQLRQTCAYITVPSTVRRVAGEIPKDEIASRLPGKYRRAYQFILSNLHREDLSIRSVADAVGVTERALQLAFRASLGLSPSAVIRQCRMDRIRDELQRGAVTNGTTTMDVGRRWGLRSRSALSHAYQEAFGELPSKTSAVVME
jgi:AraC-like DNA-binding protein